MELEEVCNLQVKDFDFTKYPVHVGRLKEYAFKAAVLQVFFFVSKIKLYGQNYIYFILDLTVIF